MNSFRSTGRTHTVAGAIALLLIAGIARAGDDRAGSPAQPAPAAAPAGETLQSINDDFNRQLLQLERMRLERLAKLAARQNPADAAVTYVQLFRLATSGNLFREAEAAANAVIKSGSPSVEARGLAHLVKIIAEADRGAYEQSIESLRQALAERQKAAQEGAPRADLPTDEIVAICDAYFQRLIHGAQYAKARDALEAIERHTQRPILKQFLANRLNRLDTVGKPAPAIEGTDLDGKPFGLSNLKGKVVLVVFWASWCVPCSTEIESLQQAAETYSGRGLAIVGINLDTVQDEAPKPETVLPNVRHFLLDHNVRWPTLLNGQGEKDYARAYGVTELPANVLVARDGTIAELDLVSKNLDAAIARQVGR